MWHASVAKGTEEECRMAALVALIGVGDPELGQWEQWSGKIFHVRRRLTEREQSQYVGPVKDIRQTAEARRRISLVPHAVEIALAIGEV